MMTTPWSRPGYVGFLDSIWRKPVRQERSEYRMKMLAFIHEEAEVLGDATIVDCGCGTGILFDYLPDSLKESGPSRGSAVPVIPQGKPVEEILRAALELRCDMIGMTTLHRGRFARSDSGSVAEEVAWRSRIPLLLGAGG